MPRSRRPRIHARVVLFLSSLYLSIDQSICFSSLSLSLLPLVRSLVHVSHCDFTRTKMESLRSQAAIAPLTARFNNKVIPHTTNIFFSVLSISVVVKYLFLFNGRKIPEKYRSWFRVPFPSFSLPARSARASNARFYSAFTVVTSRFESIRNVAVGF